MTPRSLVRPLVVLLALLAAGLVALLSPADGRGGVGAAPCAAVATPVTAAFPPGRSHGHE